MRSPADSRARADSARGDAAGPVKVRHPKGKALRRIQYFETQRSLPRTEVTPEGRVCSAAAEARPSVKRRPAVRPAAITRPYARAHEARAAMAPSFKDAAELPVWQPLGPSFIPKGQTYGTGGNNRPPVSGRCNGIVASPTDPRHLVLSSGGGGLWATLNGGATWQPLSDGQPVLSMGAIAAAPSAPNIVYAGTGEGDNESQLGLGLLRSSDGGRTWALVPATPLSGTGVFDIAVHPLDPLRLWVGTLEKLLESRNGGETWRVVQSATTWDISINPADPDEILAATAAGLVRSVNGGSTWRRVALPGTSAESVFHRLEVCHAPSAPAIVYVAGVVDEEGVLWRRARAGGAFRTETGPRLDADSDINQAWYDWCVAVSPTDPNLLLWGAVHLYRGRRSSDGWRWQNISSRSSGDSIHPDQHHIAFDPSDPNVVYVCNDGGLFRSPDAGTAWESLNKGLAIAEFEFLVHLEGDDDWIIGGTQDNGTLAHAAGGTWNQIAVGDGGDCGADEAQNLCYHSYYDMDIERARATGERPFRWSDVSPSVDEDYEALFYPPMDVVGAVVAKAGTTVFVSDDNGDSWSEIDAGLDGRASALTIVSRNVMVVGTEHGALVRLTRGRSGWGSATISALSSPRHGFISDIVVPGAPDEVIWVSCSAFGGGHVFRSRNGGSTWANRTANLPDIPVNAIVLDPADAERIFAATDHGVYQSLNAGGRWTDFSNGLPSVVVGDLIVHARRRLLRAGTRNRGAWQVHIG